MTPIYLTGLLDDGTKRDAVMPRDTATSVHVAVGQDTRFGVRVYYPSGVAVNVAALSGWTAQLIVDCTIDPCQRLPDYSFAGALAAPDVLGNKLEFTIPSSAFRGVAPGRKWFDVWLITPTERWQVIRPGAFFLEPGLVRP